MIKYLNYNNIDIEEEIKKIDGSNIIELVLEPNNKKCLFLLGIMFAKGKKIKILNENELKFDETKKSFPLMAYVWNKLSDDNFPNKDFSNVKNELDERIENIKRLGVKVEPIINKPINNKIFLICPVRNATEKDKKWIESFVEEAYNNGINIHAPHLHTVQTDLFGGYTICKQNEEAVATSNEIDIYYDKSSTGSVFDLGVAYTLHKPLRLLNQVKLDEKEFVDNLIKNWPNLKVVDYNKMSKEEALDILSKSWNRYVDYKKDEIDEIDIPIVNAKQLTKKKDQ